MTSLVPVSRAVPTERTPLTLLPPSQPRPVNENETSPKETTAVVDSSKSYASLFGSKNSVAPQQQQQQGQGQGAQGQNENMNDNHDNDSNDRNDRNDSFKHHDHDRNNDKSYQNNNNQNNIDRNFPTISNQRDRDSNARNDNSQRNNNNSDHNNDTELSSNSVARKRQLFDPKSNKMVDPELHPDNLPSQTENKNGSDKNKKGGDLVPQGGPDSTKRPRPVHPRSDEFDGQWKRGVKKAEGEIGMKNSNNAANANFIPPSDLAGGNDEDEVREQ